MNPDSSPSKRRPSKLDMSKIFSKATGSRNNRAVSSPTSLFSHGHYLPDVPLLPQELSIPIGGGPFGNGRKLSKNSKRTEILEQRRPQTAGAKPKAQSRRTKNWFDGLLEAEDRLDEAFNLEFPEDFHAINDNIPPIPTIPKRHRSPAPTRAPSQSRPDSREEFSIRIVDRSSPFRSPPNDSIYELSAKRPSWQTSSPSLRTSYIVAQSVPFNSPVDISHDHAESIEEQMTLHAEPIPTLPEVEVEKEVVVEEEENDELPGVRDSIIFDDLDDLDEIVTIAEAQTCKVLPVNSSWPPIPRSPSWAQRKQSFPIQSFPVRAGAVRRIETAPVKSKSVSVDHGSGNNIREHILTVPARPASIITLSPSFPPPKADSKHKLMAVTEEEEALLAMMRNKRAAMASSSFAAGYKTGLLASPQNSMFQPNVMANPRSRPSDIKEQSHSAPLSPPLSDASSQHTMEHNSVSEESLILPIPSQQLDKLYTSLPLSPSSTHPGMSPSATSPALSSPTTPAATRSMCDIAVVIADERSRGSSTTSSVDIMERDSLEKKELGLMSSTTSTCPSIDENCRESVEVHVVSVGSSPVRDEPQKRGLAAFRMGQETDLLSVPNANIRVGAGNRSSVIDDVMAAWSDLGGWGDLDRFRYS
jgi:hypothetical protein